MGRGLASPSRQHPRQQHAQLICPMPAAASTTHQGCSAWIKGLLSACCYARTLASTKLQTSPSGSCTESVLSPATAPTCCAVGGVPNPVALAPKPSAAGAACALNDGVLAPNAGMLPAAAGAPNARLLAAAPVPPIAKSGGLAAPKPKVLAAPKPAKARVLAAETPSAGCAAVMRHGKNVPS